MLNEETRLREVAELHCNRSGVVKPHTITVASGKGGVGKSTIALNLAVRFAELGNKTLLLDADENLGNIDVMAGIAPELRLGHVLRGERDIEDVLVSPAENLSILAGNSGDTEYSLMSIEQQSRLLADIASLEQQFDLLVIDAAAGIGPDVINLALHSDETVVATSAEPTALMDAYALVKMILRADALVPLRVVVNMVQTPEEGAATAKKLQMAVRHFLGKHVPYLGSIPYDQNVSRAIVSQNAVLTGFPATAAARSLRMLAERLMEETAHGRVRRFQTQ